jgi:hypothetical protein
MAKPTSTKNSQYGRKEGYSTNMADAISRHRDACNTPIPTHSQAMTKSRFIAAYRKL